MDPSLNIQNDKLFRIVREKLQDSIGGGLDQNKIIKLYENLTPNNAAETNKIYQCMCSKRQHASNISQIKYGAYITLVCGGLWGLTFLAEYTFSLQENQNIQHIKNITGGIGVFGLFVILGTGH